MSLPPTPVRCDDTKKVEQQTKSAWFQFFKSIATFKGDLTSLSAPPFLLSPESICQFSRYFNEYPSLLVAPADEESAEIRSLLVLKWFLSTLRLQHATTNEDGTRRKLKPLNPFLGEIFLGKWIDEEGSAHDLISEAVSHHPPCTAYRISNRDHGVTVQGQVEPKARFTGGTVNITRQGTGILHIEKHDERHVFTMPDIFLEGIVTFQITPELKGTSYIRSSSGYTTKINYSCKGWLSGKSNSFVATLFRDDAENSPLYTLEGQWSGCYTIKDRNGKIIETVDLTSLRKAPFHVAPLEEQHPLETGKAWQGVIEGIMNNDIFAVGHEKSKLENAQRALRRQEKAEGRVWERRYFTSGPQDPIIENLALAESGKDAEHVWNFDQSKYDRIVETQRLGLKSPARARFDSMDSGVAFFGDDVSV